MLRRRATNTGSYFARAKDHVTWFGSGCKPLDLALGGGWAAPYIINVVGDKSSGKTLLAIEAAINFCKVFPRGEVIYKRAERTFDPPYAEALGLPLDRVDLGTESVVVVEDIYAELDRLTAKGRKTPPPRLYVIDSWDAVKHKAELERGIGEADYGRKALLLSEFLRRLEAPMVDAKVTLFMISQTRAAIGSLFKKQQRSGGVALDFYASQIVWLHQAGFIQRETTIDGKKVTRRPAPASSPTSIRTSLACNPGAPISICSMATAPMTLKPAWTSSTNPVACPSFAPRSTAPSRRS